MPDTTELKPLVLIADERATGRRVDELDLEPYAHIVAGAADTHHLL